MSASAAPRGTLDDDDQRADRRLLGPLDDAVCAAQRRGRNTDEAVTSGAT